VPLGQQRGESRVDLNCYVTAPPAEAILDHAGARSGARAKLGNDRVTAFRYRHAQ
jgi:hypothetical protein